VANDKHILVVSTSKLSINELLDRIDDTEGVVQLFDESAIACREHLEFAYLNAVRMRERKESRTKSLAMEMMLCAAMTSQIGDAIKRVGARNGRPFIVFSDSKKAYDRLSQYLLRPVEFDPKGEVKVRLVRIGIRSGKVEDLIQEIALHAMDR
jgi:tRNA threonylcarbamoyladenosine modification (KEOPS) complex Cgi121 subunit